MQTSISSSDAAVITADQSGADRSATIAKLNDAFRQDGRGMGRQLITQGIDSQGPDFVVRVMMAVRGFDEFTPENDPHAEHDFGSFEIDETKCFWKIDYYDHSLEQSSEDPADPSVTTRVLTIMLASEY